MAIKLEDKKAIVAEVNEAAKAALSAVVADARGVTVGAMTGLRKEAREAGVYVKVVRNTLLKRAVEGAVRRAQRRVQRPDPDRFLQRTSGRCRSYLP